MVARDSDEIVLCCVLWAQPGRSSELGEYETRVLALLPDHGGEVIRRAKSDGSNGRPDETQLLRFASQSGIDSYLVDPRRLALADERDRAIARTELFPVDLI